MKIINFIVVTIMISYISLARASESPQKNPSGKIVVSTLNEIRLLDLKTVTDIKPQWRVALKGQDEYRYPALSPDGKQIALSYLSWEKSKPSPTREKAYYELITANTEGIIENKLLSNHANYEYPAWSPDGRLIACIVYPNWPEKRAGKICLLQKTSGKLDCIEKLDVSIARPAWSFDGKLLTFTTTDKAIVLYDWKKSHYTILQQTGYSPIFHPDGKHIYYVESDNNALCSIKLDGSNRIIVNKVFIDYLVQFSKDGKYLLYVGGGYHGAIIPGPEYSSLVFLNLNNGKSLTLDKFSVVYGVSWVE